MSSLTLSTYVSPSNAWEFVTQQAEKHKSIHWLSRELVLHIFGSLSPKDLGRTSCVCREWEMLSSDNSLWNAFDLKKLFPSLQAIDETVWKTHVDLAALGLEIKGAPPLDKSDIATLNSLLASVQIEKDAGITVLTMPKGLTLNKLVTLAKSPKQGNSTNFDYIWRRVLEGLGNNPVEKTYRVAITNSVLQGSRRLSVSARQELVNKIGCEMPGVLPAATLAILTYIISQAVSPTRLYNDNPWTYTRCCEQIDSDDLMVGGFSSAGLRISGCGSYIGLGVDGVGALWKL